VPDRRAAEAQSDGSRIADGLYQGEMVPAVERGS
jgi:hypothetical protein